ncbi:NAD-dependent epimerase/dehydratase family protein [Bacteroidota bacterium]
MRLAVTGASGHIGANLCRGLLKKGHEIKVLIHNSQESLEGLPVEQVRGNLHNMESLNTLIDGVEMLIHLGAAISIDRDLSERVIETNVEGTKNILQIVKQHSSVKRFIHFSSIHALQNEPIDKPLDESRPLVIGDANIYNHSKAKGEQLVLDEVKNGLDAVIISPTSVIGPNDFAPSLVGQAIIQICNNKLPALVSGGYDWVDVRDVVDGTISAIEKGKTGERYLLSGNWESLSNLNLFIKQIHPETKKLLVMPHWLAFLGVPFLKVWAQTMKKRPLYTRESIDILKSGHRNILSLKAKNELDYKCRPLLETLRDTIHWFKQHRYIR